MGCRLLQPRAQAAASGVNSLELVLDAAPLSPRPAKSESRSAGVQKG